MVYKSISTNENVILKGDIKENIALKGELLQKQWGTSCFRHIKVKAYEKQLYYINRR